MTLEPARTARHGRFSSRVQAVVDRYGPADFSTIPLDLQRGLFMVLCLGSADPKSPAVQRALPLSHVSKNAAPVLRFHSRNDQVVPFRQSERFCEAMRKAGAAPRNSARSELADMQRRWLAKRRTIELPMTSAGKRSWRGSMNT